MLQNFMTAVFLAVGSLLLGFNPALADQPSFDCAKAKSVVEKTICADPDLAAADRKMADTFRKILAGAGSDARQEILVAQNVWLKQISDCAPPDDGPQPNDDPDVAACLADQYEKYDKDIAQRLALRAQGMFHPSKFPFLPHVVQSMNRPLCNALTDRLRMAYLAVDSAFASEDMSLPRGRYVDWAPDYPSTGNETLREIAVEKVDLEGDGHTELLVGYLVNVDYLDDIVRLLVYKNSDVVKLNRQLHQFDNDFIGDNDSDLITVQQDRQRRLESPPQVLIYNNRYYITEYRPYGPFAYNEQDVLHINRIRSDGSLERTCSISVQPEIRGANAQPTQGLSDTSDSIIAPNSFLQLTDLIRQMEGTAWENGAYKPFGAMQVVSDQLQSSVIARPWLVFGAKMPAAGAKMTVPSALIDWAFEGYANFRLLRQLARVGPKASADLAAFYRNNYGLSAANSEAAGRLGLQAIITGGFQFPTKQVDGTDGNTLVPLDEATLSAKAVPSLDERGPYFQRWILPRHALLAGASPEIVGSLLDEVGLQQDDRDEPWLTYALERPTLMKLLLERGVDIDQGNAFGKTALMYAAQADLPATVRFLIAQGADVTAATDVTRGSMVFLSHDHRTALMYAAENASATVIDALLAAGASPDDRDTRGLAPIDYFQRNPIHSGPDGARLSARLTPKNGPLKKSP